jgi:protein required for attachment to host cells
MSKIDLDHDVWVLVSDARKALILHNAGDRVFPKLEVRETLEHPDPLSHELGTDKPGSTFSSAKDGRRAGTEPPDYQGQAEEAFLKAVAADIGRRVASGEIKKLIVVAPPRAMGLLRRDFSSAARAVIKAELEKDYVRQPVYEIERHLTHA